MNTSNRLAAVIAFCLLLTTCACAALLIVGFNDPCLGFDPPTCDPERLTAPIIVVWLPTDTPAPASTAARYPTITPDGSQYRWMIPTPGPGQAPMPQAWTRPQYCNAYDCAPATGTPACVLEGQQWYCK